MADKLTRSLHLVPPSLRLRSRYEEALFQAVFERQFAAWRKAGYGDFIAVLCAEAYAMLRDQAWANLPSEITAHCSGLGFPIAELLATQNRLGRS
jgi:hypothetical protein